MENSNINSDFYKSIFTGIPTNKPFGWQDIFGPIPSIEKSTDLSIKKYSELTPDAWIYNPPVFVVDGLKTYVERMMSLSFIKDIVTFGTLEKGQKTIDYFKVTFEPTSAVPTAFGAINPVNNGSKSEWKRFPTCRIGKGVSFTQELLKTIKGREYAQLMITQAFKGHEVYFRENAVKILRSIPNFFDQLSPLATYIDFYNNLRRDVIDWNMGRTNNGIELITQRAIEELSTIGVYPTQLIVPPLSSLKYLKSNQEKIKQFEKQSKGNEGFLSGKADVELINGLNVSIVRPMVMSETSKTAGYYDPFRTFNSIGEFYKLSTDLLSKPPVGDSDDPWVRRFDTGIYSQKTDQIHVVSMEQALKKCYFMDEKGYVRTPKYSPVNMKINGYEHFKDYDLFSIGDNNIPIDFIGQMKNFSTDTIDKMTSFFDKKNINIIPVLKDKPLLKDLLNNQNLSLFELLNKVDDKNLLPINNIFNNSFYNIIEWDNYNNELLNKFVEVTKENSILSFKQLPIGQSNDKNNILSNFINNCVTPFIPVWLYKKTENDNTAKFDFKEYNKGNINLENFFKELKKSVGGITKTIFEKLFDENAPIPDLVDLTEKFLDENVDPNKSIAIGKEVYSKLLFKKNEIETKLYYWCELAITIAKYVKFQEKKKEPKKKEVLNIELKEGGGEEPKEGGEAELLKVNKEEDLIKEIIVVFKKLTDNITDSYEKIKTLSISILDLDKILELIIGTKELDDDDFTEYDKTLKKLGVNDTNEYIEKMDLFSKLKEKTLDISKKTKTFLPNYKRVLLNDTVIAIGNRKTIRSLYNHEFLAFINSIVEILDKNDYLNKDIKKYLIDQEKKFVLNDFINLLNKFQKEDTKKIIDMIQSEWKNMLLMMNNIGKKMKNFFDINKNLIDFIIKSGNIENNDKMVEKHLTNIRLTKTLLKEIKDSEKEFGKIKYKKDNPEQPYYLMVPSYDNFYAPGDIEDLHKFYFDAVNKTGKYKMFLDYEDLHKLSLFDTIEPMIMYGDTIDKGNKSILKNSKLKDFYDYEKNPKTKIAIETFEEYKEKTKDPLKLAYTRLIFFTPMKRDSLLELYKIGMYPPFTFIIARENMLYQGYGLSITTDKPIDGKLGDIEANIETDIHGMYSMNTNSVVGFGIRNTKNIYNKNNIIIEIANGGSHVKFYNPQKRIAKKDDYFNPYMNIYGDRNKDHSLKSIPISHEELKNSDLIDLTGEFTKEIKGGKIKRGQFGKKPLINCCYGFCNFWGYRFSGEATTPERNNQNPLKSYEPNTKCWLGTSYKRKDGSYTFELNTSGTGHWAKASFPGYKDFREGKTDIINFLDPKLNMK